MPIQCKGIQTKPLKHLFESIPLHKLLLLQAGKQKVKLDNDKDANIRFLHSCKSVT